MTCVSWKKNDKKNKICQEFEWLDVFFKSANVSMSFSLICQVKFVFCWQFVAKHLNSWKFCLQMWATFTGFYILSFISLFWGCPYSCKVPLWLYYRAARRSSKQCGKSFWQKLSCQWHYLLPVSVPVAWSSTTMKKVILFFLLPHRVSL